MLPLFIKQKLKHYPLIVKVWNLVHCHKSQPSISGPISYGDENPDKTFYVICRNDKAGGAWSLLVQMLTHFAYAIDNGYVPIVDMKNFRNQYVSDEDFRKVNIWERFFEQPFGYTLDDISRSKNVIISSAFCPDMKYFMGLGSNIWDDEAKLSFMQGFFIKYVRFSKFTQDYIDTEVNKVFGNNRKVIGVLCRGTDYIVDRPAFHNIQPTPGQVIDDVRKVMEDDGCDAVFLATEDQDIFDEFSKAFGNKLFSIAQNRIRKKAMSGKEWLSAERSRLFPEEDKNMSFLSYFTSTYILSQCDYFFAGRNAGSAGVLIMPHNFSKCVLYKLGRY